MVKIIDGNLLESGADIICHQVNCQGKMASGVAAQISTRYPNVYNSYNWWCKMYEPADLLGQVQFVAINEKTLIANMFSQDQYGYDGKQYTSIQAFKSCLIKIHDKAFSNHLRIAMPYKIGCVRGGANWDEVYAIIEEVFEDYEVELWRLDKG